MKSKYHGLLNAVTKLVYDREIIHCEHCGYYRPEKFTCVGPPGDPPLIRYPYDFCSKGNRKPN